MEGAGKFNGFEVACVEDDCAAGLQGGSELALQNKHENGQKCPGKNLFDLE